MQPPTAAARPRVPPTDRGAFIDQSQSFNVHMSDPNFGKLTSLHFYAWKKGLKTGAPRFEARGSRLRC